jgi:hypothetical protein
MDDNKFDDIVKGKVGEYADASFEPSALAALHHRLATDSDWPWHVRYRNEMVLGATATLVILFTLWGQWYFAGQGERQIQNDFQLLKVQNEQLNDLLREMKNVSGTNADTIRVIEIRERDPQLYAPLVQQIEILRNALTDSFANMSNRNLAESKAVHSKNREALIGSFGNNFHPFPIHLFSKDNPDSTKNAIDSNIQEGKKLTAKEIRKTENYRKGVGFRIGPIADLSKGFYRAGTGEGSLGFGVLGDIILSPSLSVEAGLKFVHRFNSVPEDDLNKLTLAHANQSIGDVKLAEIDAWIAEIPINFKYRYPLSRKSSLLTAIGYSPMFITKQTLEYSYQYDTSTDIYLKDSHDETGLRFNPGAINISIGLSKQLKNKKILEGGVFFQQGLGEMGVEKNRLSSLGVRGVYWFPVR